MVVTQTKSKKKEKRKKKGFRPLAPVLKFPSTRLQVSFFKPNRHIIDTIDTCKDMYKYFRHQPAMELQGCSLAVAVLFVKYFNIYE